MNEQPKMIGEYTWTLGQFIFKQRSMLVKGYIERYTGRRISQLPKTWVIDNTFMHVSADGVETLMRRTESGSYLPIAVFYPFEVDTTTGSSSTVIKMTFKHQYVGAGEGVDMPELVDDCEDCDE